MGLARAADEADTLLVLAAVAAFAILARAGVAAATAVVAGTFGVN